MSCFFNFNLTSQIRKRPWSPYSLHIKKGGKVSRDSKLGCHCSTERALEMAWGGRRTSDQLVPKHYEAAKLGEVAGSLQLALFGPKWDIFTCILAQQGSAPRAEKGASACRKGHQSQWKCVYHLEKSLRVGGQRGAPKLFTPRSQQHQLISPWYVICIFADAFSVTTVLVPCSNVKKPHWIALLHWQNLGFLMDHANQLWGQTSPAALTLPKTQRCFKESI